LKSETIDGTPHSLSDLMAQALAMELEAAQRYTELADAMETANNRDVAALFRALAHHEGEHANQVMREMGWREPNDAPLADASWSGFEAPGTVPSDEAHYLMQPWHALKLALAAEQRAEKFFAALAKAATTDEVRRAAVALQAEEAEHVRLIEQWLAKVPAPQGDWANDPDPPRYTD
jgi:rubrerythrin